MNFCDTFKKTMMITGLRPQKLPKIYGTNYKTEAWLKAIKIFKEILIKNQISEAITGMAIGADMAFACAVLQLKKEGYNITLSCYLPDVHQDEKWDNYSKTLYQKILKKADLIIYLSNEYSSLNYLKRNIKMIEESDIVLGFWDMKTNGGTAFTLDKAQKSKKEIILIDPLNLKIIERFKKEKI